MCAVNLDCYLNLWRTLTGVKYYAMVIKKWRMNDEVILISAPWRVCAVGTSVSANLAPVVQRDCPWPERGPLNYSWPAHWQLALRPDYPQPPGSVRVILGPGGAPLGFWIRASTRGLPDPGLVHPGPCPREPLMRPGVRLSRSRPTP
jgi:hypothetical protein